ncbi:hypothetical protein RRG08_020232 [Elysia crispata]|uniref:Uncharacterized protein n=1 Tax=Elysia crispata TaxID=231223 RepID=A0AAE1A2S6_9GAST|nr:hypothetical protein RRG08_020232 [Elysia crispata]
MEVPDDHPSLSTLPLTRDDIRHRTTGHGSDHSTPETARAGVYGDVIGGASGQHRGGFCRGMGAEERECVIQYKKIYRHKTPALIQWSTTKDHHLLTSDDGAEDPSYGLGHRSLCLVDQHNKECVAGSTLVENDPLTAAITQSAFCMNRFRSLRGQQHGHKTVLEPIKLEISKENTVGILHKYFLLCVSSWAINKTLSSKGMHVCRQLQHSRCGQKLTVYRPVRSEDYQRPGARAPCHHHRPSTGPAKRGFCLNCTNRGQNDVETYMSFSEQALILAWGLCQNVEHSRLPLPSVEERAVEIPSVNNGRPACWQVALFEDTTFIARSGVRGGMRVLWETLSV